MLHEHLLTKSSTAPATPCVFASRPLSPNRPFRPFITFISFGLERMVKKRPSRWLRQLTVPVA